MQKKGFCLFSQWIVYFSSFVRPGKLFRNFLKFSGRLFKFLIVYIKKGVLGVSISFPFVGIKI